MSIIQQRNMAMDEIISMQRKHEEALFELAVRVNCTPVIKGEITRGKIKWRGIYWCRESGSTKFWIEQRGKKISPIMELVIDDKSARIIYA